MTNQRETRNLQLAFSLHQSGKLDEAAKLYREIIKRNPGSVHAAHSLGLIEAGSGNLTEAARLMSCSLLLAPANIQFIENYATVLYQLGDYENALEISLQGCRVDNANKRCLCVSAISFLRLQRLQEASSQFDRLLFQELWLFEGN